MADFELSAIEGRVLGCLLEKDMATPEYYPLSLNALTNACNQKSNRNPVVSYDEQTVEAAIEELKGRQLVWQSVAGRVPKFAHNLDKSLKLIRREAAIICLLLLRGPQTPGELRGRSERLYNFADLAEVNEALDSLAEMGLVRKLPRQPGRKESRYAHLLGGGAVESDLNTAASTETHAAEPGAADERITALAAEVASLREELRTLEQELAEFKKQFD